MKSAAAASLLVFLAIASLAAQGPPDRGGGFGPGGPRRGFGFGGPGGSPSSSVALLEVPGVQEELGTSAEQKKRLEEVLGRAREAMQSAFADVDFRELQDLAPEEREKRLAGARS